jgi:DNA-binding CsgD family transcriptional regulator
MSSVVGRKDELEAIDAFLESVEGGRSSVMLLSGMAGIGKTTLWHAGIASAKDRRYRVVTARPTEVETGLAFASLGDLLTPLLDGPPPDLPGPQREALDAALLRVSAISPPQPLGVSLGALHVLRAAADAAPVLLAIDDVPWLDEASARVLDFSMRRLETDRVGFLLARRAATQDEPLPSWLATLPADRMMRRDVPALSVDETDALLRAHLRLNLPRPVLTRLHAISGGTPFYALELGRDLQRRGGRPTPESLAVPRSLEGLVGARVAALDPAADDVALYAAALAQPTVRVLEAALGTERFLAGLEGAVAAGVLESTGDGVRFTHPLLAAAAYSRASPSRRRDVHERLAGFATAPEERARHLARTAVGPERSIAAALDEGAAAAARRGAPEVAASLAEEAVRLTPSDAVDDGRRRRIAESEYLFSAGDAKRADAILTLVATELSPGPLLGHVLARRALFALMFADLDAADALFRRAMPMAAEDLRLRIAIHSGLAGIGYLSWRGWRRARLDMFRALRLAQELGDRGVEFQALGHMASWLSSLGRPWRHLLERADALGVPIEGVPLLEHPDLQFSRILSYHGDAAEGRRRVQRLIEHARSSGDWTTISRLLAVLAEIEFDAGDLDASERISTEAHAGILQTGEGAFHQDILSTRLHLLVMRGEVAAARALAAEVEPIAQASAYPWFRSTVQVSLAMLDHSTGQAAAAYERFAALMSEPGLGRLAPLHWETIVAYTADSLVSLGRLDEARRLLDPVERRARRRAGDWPAAVGEVARARALVLAADGDHPGAVRHAEEAVRIHAGLQVPFRTARGWFTLGEVLRRSRQKGASREAFGSALDLFTRLGAKVWIERTQAELGRVATRRPAGSALTETERRVAELAASGQTNREIADALFISVHTVEAHLTRVYRRLGVQSRTELARLDLGTSGS